MSPRASRERLPSAGVHFDDDFRRRLGGFAMRMRSASERREGAGRARLFGVGTEFVGHRPYRPGEDLRLLDWQLFARLRRPFVRVARREASERWAIAVDTSASMGVGRPGKLQSVAEVASAVAVAGLEIGASVELWTSRERSVFRMRRKSDLPAWLDFLEGVRAEGDQGLGSLLTEPARFASAGRLFLFGDFLDLEPAALSGVIRRGRELFCGQALAPEELLPTADGAVEWYDPESGEHHAIERNTTNLERYEELLTARLESWRTFAARHRASFLTWSTNRAFEDAATDLL